MKTSSVFSIRTILALSTAVIVLAPAQSFAQPKAFSFSNVEFMPMDQREPAVQGFVARNITPGMPVSRARLVLRRAGAYCPPMQAGVLTCTRASMQRHPGHSLQDVTWKVSVQADGAGRVLNTAVQRSVAGN